MPTARCPPRAGPATSWDDERPRQLPEAFGAAPGTRAAAVLSTGRGSLLALVGHGLGGGLRGDRVEVAPALLKGLEVLVQLVDQRLAGGDVQPRDLLVGDAVEVFHQRTQRVAVGGEEHRSEERRVGKECKRRAAAYC